jgi:signal transduction histidine kinase
VVTAFVNNDTLREGVNSSWLILAALGLVVVVGTVPLADRLAVSITRPVRELSDAAHRWAGGDLSARVVPSGPNEVVESGEAFNQLAERLTDLLAAERERVADLSHRLRTPIAALRLQAESVTAPNERRALIGDIAHLEGEVTALIEDVRRTESAEATICDLPAVVAQRMGFWRVVASAQQRTVTAEVDETRPLLVNLPAAKVLSVLDNLVQNVLTHTVAGVGFMVSVAFGPPRLTISDEGDGLPSTDVFDRGFSSGSSGLGLDIVRRVAEESGGDVTLGNGPGTTIVVRFGEPVSPTEAR